MKRYIIPLTLIFAAHTAASGAPQNVLSVSDATMSPSVIMPESAETDTRRMQEMWYLQNYAVLDANADSRADGDLSEEVIVERLSMLPTVIEMPYNSVVASSIRYYVGRKQLVENMLGLSLYYMPIFEEALERHGLPRELKYLPVIESALVPTAKSRVGAGGLWQFMPSTGSGLGLEQNSLVDMRFDPYSSSEAGARYLKQLYQTFGDWSLAIAAYNCGPGNINKALRRCGEGKHDFWDIYPFLPRETRGYFPAFIAANYIMTYHKNHNISPALARRPIVTDTVHVSRRVHFDQISEVLDIPVAELRALNPQYRQDIIPGDIKPYALVLPSLQAYAYAANEDTIVNHNASRYARRGVVEPSDGTITGSDSRGEYVMESTIQWHKVKRGETLASIARQYGTTVSEIRQLNNCGKRVQRGQRLKIRTTTRRYVTPAAVPTPAEPEIAATRSDSIEAAAADSSAAALIATIPVDSAATASAMRDAFATEVPPTTNPSQPEPEPAPAQQNTAPARRNTGNHSSQRRTVHTVRRGENLTKIARRYGVTVNSLKRANNITGDEIRVGQRLTIPTN